MLGGGGKLAALFRRQLRKPGGKVIQLVDVVKVTHFIVKSPDTGTALQDNDLLISKAVHADFPQGRLDLLRRGGKRQNSFGQLPGAILAQVGNIGVKFHYRPGVFPR